MNFNESLKIALKSIKANWMRSLLTMLGIIIGVSSVILIVSAGTGARDYIVTLIQDMGSNAVMISVDDKQASTADYITVEDIENLKEKVDGVDYCSPFIYGFAKGVITRTEKNATIMLIGVNSDIQYSLTSDCSYGRFFNDEEYAAASPLAVMGVNSAMEAFGYEDVTGETIQVTAEGKSAQIRVSGIANVDSLVSSVGGDSSSVMSSMFQTGDDVTIALFVPATTYEQLMGEMKINSVFVVANEGADNDAVSNSVVNYLKSAHNNFSKGLYSGTNMASYIGVVNIVMQVLTAFVAGVGAISLIVGGIGVMNIMLVSVTERTREIGIRKSLGAKTSVITLQFLTESIIMCFIGGLIGVLFGVGGAYGLCSIVGITPKLSIGTICIALVFSSGVGLFFGIYPARKAAKLSPIEALRRE